jgi:hypothetical protein
MVSEFRSVPMCCDILFLHFRQILVAIAEPKLKYDKSKITLDTHQYAPSTSDTAQALHSPRVKLKHSLVASIQGSYEHELKSYTLRVTS